MHLVIIKPCGLMAAGVCNVPILYTIDCSPMNKLEGELSLPFMKDQHNSLSKWIR